MGDAAHIIGWTDHGTLQNMRDCLLQHSVALQADGVEVTFRLQRLIKLGDGKSRVSAKEAQQVKGLVAGNDGSKNLFPAIGAVNIGPVG